MQGIKVSKMAFLLHRALKQMIDLEWEIPEAGLRGSRAMQRLYPEQPRRKMLRLLKVDSLVTA